jgi:hypothetical protein
MIKVFGKIRQKLLGQGKVTRYLAYAFGEIILVVVGILIALQVNNWNELRKDRQAEVKILREIHANLQEDLRYFDKGIDLLTDTKISCQSLLEVVLQDLPYDETYGYYLFYLSLYPRFDRNSSGYQLLKTKGLDLISNDNLRMAITNLYEIGYESLLTKEKESKENRNLELRPSLRYYQGMKALTGANGPESLTLEEVASQLGRYRTMINFDRFKEDSQFHWVINDIEITSNVEIRRYERTKEQVEALLKLLKEAIH